MASIAAVKGENQGKVKDRLAKGMHCLSHRGHDGLKKVFACLAGSQAKQAKSRRFSLALDGEIFNYWELDKKANNSLEAVELFFDKELKRKSMLASVQEFLGKANGSFAVTLEFKNKLYAFRDFIGLKPLWFGESYYFQGIGSEPRFLKEELGTTFPSPLKPGFLLELNSHGFKQAKAFDLTDFQKTIPKKSSAKRLKEEFLKATELRAKGLKKAAVSFSGGIDSSLVAVALQRFVPNVELFTVGLEGAHDIKAAEETAEKLGLKLHKRIVEKEEVFDYLLKTMKTLYLFDSMQLQIGLPEFITAEAVKKKGFSHVFAGQGSDEIFAGYASFNTALKNYGFKGVKEETWAQLKTTSERNLYRDEIIAARHGLELRLPFLDVGFLKEAMALPAKALIHSKNDSLRKHALRQLGKELGVPEEAVQRQKKALQYGSGLSKEVKKILA